MTPRAHSIVHTLTSMSPLADLPRTGWLMRGVSSPESIAAHSFGVALCTLLLVDALREEGVPINGEKALRMAIVHDATEAATGDIPRPVKTPELKAALTVAERGVAANLLTASALEDWRALSETTSIETQVVKAADTIHMFAQALVYERQHRGQLSEFWVGFDQRSPHPLPIVDEVFTLLADERDQLSP